MKMFNSKKSRLLKILIFVLPICFLFLFYSLRKNNVVLYLDLVQEDLFVENITSGIYFISSLVAAKISLSLYKQKKNLIGALYLCLALGMFFVSGEEISWGQRIIDVTSPQFFVEHNSQREISIHNLYPIQKVLHQSYILVGLFGASSWLFLFRIQKKQNFPIYLFSPTWYISSYFFQAALFYIYFEYFRPKNDVLGLSFQDQEPVELILSMGFLLFITINMCRQNQKTNFESF
ncbi:MAG: hypothetical protein GY755_07850 [Chloroflexi bacterium]|nr:hypothetical protein [Chloroflexota bacterium]